MDDRWKSRIRELLFYVVPDPDEVVTDEVLARSGAVDYREEVRLRTEFRALIEELDDWPDVRRVVLDALDAMDDASRDSSSDGVEWENVHDVMGRRVRKALTHVL
jgi:hypothetical protein